MLAFAGGVLIRASTRQDIDSKSPKNNIERKERMFLMSVFKRKFGTREVDDILSDYCPGF